MLHGLVEPQWFPRPVEDTGSRYVYADATEACVLLPCVLTVMVSSHTHFDLSFDLFDGFLSTLFIELKRLLSNNHHNNRQFYPSIGIRLLFSASLFLSC